MTRGVMKREYTWTRFYQSALFELSPEKARLIAQQTRDTLRKRSAELSHDPEGNALELDDLRRSLKVIDLLVDPRRH